MNANRFITGLIMAFCLGLCSPAWAIEPETAALHPAPAQSTDPAYGRETIVKGVVEKAEFGLFLLYGKGTFRLEGDNEMNKLAGRAVEIRGILKKGEKEDIILVQQARVLR